MEVRYQLPQPYRDIEHTADVGVEVEGASAEEALARLVLAQSSLMTGGEAVEVEREERVRVPAGERVAMALALLRELLFRFATVHVVAGTCEVLSLEPSSGAEVSIGVGRFDPVRHREGLDLKAVTWHQASFAPAGAGWRARVVFDV